MGIAVTLALQAAAQAAPAPAPPAAAIDFDLARYQPSEGGDECRRGEGDIVVCGRRNRAGDYPIELWQRVFAQRPLVAEAGLGGAVTGRAFVESAQMPNGMVSNRVMVGIRVPF
ncbi:MAG TPA: hypothetical protein VGX37_09730 [Allosphingosinicella sp.]|jgi:hypothetical protein|nr:hypothetical protein [Allosphingosinicella sp.]